MIKITGCEYKLTEENLKSALRYWGSVTSEIKEELFVDPHDSDGTNRTGIYQASMILDSEMPELIPVDGLRVRLQYQGVSKLCSGCYGRHLRKGCKFPKITWPDYVKQFRESNPEIPDDFYGENLEKLLNPKSKKGIPKISC